MSRKEKDFYVGLVVREKPSTVPLSMNKLCAISSQTAFSSFQQLTLFCFTNRDKTGTIHWSLCYCDIMHCHISSQDFLKGYCFFLFCIASPSLVCDFFCRVVSSSWKPDMKMTNKLEQMSMSAILSSSSSSSSSSSLSSSTRCTLLQPSQHWCVYM